MLRSGPLALLSLLSLFGCGARLTPGGSEPTMSPAADADDRELAFLDRELERQIVEHGLVYRDEALTGYLDRVGARLVAAAGDPRVEFRFVALRDPAVNAFATSQGGVFVNAGLFARLDSEAELAEVLAHEMAHTRGRHQRRTLHDFEAKTMTAKLANLLSGGVVAPALALAYAASVNGYGRELERQADLEALRTMAAAGYAPAEARRIFASLEQSPAPSALQIYFYGNHPANEERARYVDEALRSFAGSIDAGTIGADEYRSATHAIALESLRLCLQNRLYQTALDSARVLRERRGDDPWLDYYSAEAHRLMAADAEGAALEAAARERREVRRGDIDAFQTRAAVERQSALDGYRRALAGDRSLTLAHRGIGLVARESGDPVTARAELELYLADPAAADDRRRIEKIVAEVNR